MRQQFLKNVFSGPSFGRKLLLVCLFVMIFVQLPLRVVHCSADTPASSQKLMVDGQTIHVPADMQDKARLKGAESLSMDPHMIFRNLFSSKKVKLRLQELGKCLECWPEQKEQIWNNMTAHRGVGGLGEILAAFVFVMLVGWATEKLVGWKLDKVKKNITRQQSSEWQESLGFLTLRLLCSLAGLAVFTTAAMLTMAVLYDSSDPFHITVHILTVIVISIRLVSVLADTALAPRTAGIRLFDLKFSQATSMYWWTIIFTGTYFVIREGFVLLEHFGLDPVMGALTRPMLSLLLNIILLLFILTNKDTITRLFLSDRDSEKVSRVRDVIIQVWPTMVVFSLLFLWAVYSFHVFSGNTYLAKQLAPTWWILIAFPFIDRSIYALLCHLQKSPLLQSRTSEERSRKFNRRILKGIRLIIAFIAIVQLCKGLGLDIWAMAEADVVHQAVSATINIAILFFLAYLCWEIIQAWIERRLPEPPEKSSDEFDLEGGGPGATRAETLLPLVRYSVAVVLVIIVLFSALDMLGVKIMPLIASAGVVGIAIGFGAQKLVQDIISGFFFLLDDAFRRGEYIEVAGMRGTVEKISVRSMRLRHHRGAVQTIPFGEISTVSNISRDWITMKLEFRLSYDVDIEKVRKVIKKVGEAMLEDEEMGNNFILPLKSQGVTRIEESTLIVRAKFTCKPGEQFVIRRETYRRVKEGLEAAGIHFAHRAVHVLVPEIETAGEKNGNQTSDKAAMDKDALVKAASAAILSSEQEKKDIEKHDKFDD